MTNPMTSTAAVGLNGLQKRLRDLARIHGGYRALGRLYGVDHAYLCKLRRGEKNNPSDELLAKLNLRRIVTITYKDAR